MTYMNEYDPKEEQDKIIAFLDSLIETGACNAYLSKDEFLHLAQYDLYNGRCKYDYDPFGGNGELGVLGMYKKKLKIMPMIKTENE